jgi:hypothetical protein
MTSAQAAWEPTQGGHRLGDRFALPRVPEPGSLQSREQARRAAVPQEPPGGIGHPVWLDDGTPASGS